MSATGEGRLRAGRWSRRRERRIDFGRNTDNLWPGRRERNAPRLADMPDATHPRAPGQGAWPVVWRYGLATLWWVLIAGLYAFVSFAGDPRPPQPIVVIDLVLGAAAIWGMRFRHRWPRGLAVVTTLLGVLSTSSFFAALWAFAHLATRRRWQEIVGYGAFVVISGTVLSQVNISGLAAQSAPLTLRDVLIGTAGSAVIVALVAAIGSYVGARRDLLRPRRREDPRPSPHRAPEGLLGGRGAHPARRAASA